jgi:hypothetical protein
MLLFFGVLHRGLPEASVKSISSRLWQGMKEMESFGKGYDATFEQMHKDSSDERLRWLSSKSTELRRNFEDFAKISGRFQIYSFYPTAGMHGEANEEVGFEDYMNYCMGLPNEQLIRRDEDHDVLATFDDDRTDRDYLRVLNILRRGLRTHTRVSQEGWMIDQVFRLGESER